MKHFRELIIERGSDVPWFPRYRVLVRSDGAVEWDGKSAVVEVGRREWHLPPDRIDALQATLEHGRLSEFSHSSHREGEHPPLPTIRVVFEDGTEIVTNSLDSWMDADATATLLKRFNTVADAIDEIVGTARFVRTQPPAKMRSMSFLNLTLERGPCFGTCPMYAVNVGRDGRVDWIGKMFVEAEGERSWLVSDEVVEKLRQSLVRAKFADLEDQYDKYGMTDQSSATITVQFLDGRVKRVYHYHGHWTRSPEERAVVDRLTWLQNRIDRLLGTKEYIGEPL